MRVAYVIRDPAAVGIRGAMRPEVVAVVRESHGAAGAYETAVRVARDTHPAHHGFVIVETSNAVAAAIDVERVAA